MDRRTRPINAEGPADPESFFEVDWRAAVARNGRRAAADAARLGLNPLAIRVDGDVWTIEPRGETIDVVPGRDETTSPCVTLDSSCIRRPVLRASHRARTGHRRPASKATPCVDDAFCAWDPVFRSLLDGRPVYQPGEVTLQSSNGSPLELDQRFRLGEQTPEAAHFLAEAGFLLLQDVFTEAEMDAVDADLAHAVGAARADDGSSWWATTRTGERYPCRILDFAAKSPALRALIADDRYLAIGELLGDGHRPGDPFGEHFADVTGEGLLKRVDSVDGLVCLPWHKDCDRGGHSMFCSGLTIGICLTPVDEAHGGLDVMAGSHRANIARAQIDDALGLPAVSRSAPSAAMSRYTCPVPCTARRIPGAGSAAWPTPDSRSRRVPGTRTNMTRRGGCATSGRRLAVRTALRSPRPSQELSNNALGVVCVRWPQLIGSRSSQRFPAGS